MFSECSLLITCKPDDTDMLYNTLHSHSFSRRRRPPPITRAVHPPVATGNRKLKSIVLLEHTPLLVLLIKDKSHP